jgi:hypothetical protein
MCVSRVKHTRQDFATLFYSSGPTQQDLRSSSSLLRGHGQTCLLIDGHALDVLVVVPSQRRHTTMIFSCGHELKGPNPLSPLTRTPTRHAQVVSRGANRSLCIFDIGLLCIIIAQKIYVTNRNI